MATPNTTHPSFPVHRPSKVLTFGMVCAFFFASVFASAQQPTGAKIFHIQNYFSEAYLVKGTTDQLILIETGVPVPGYQDSLVKSIHALGFQPENIALAIVTHGHGDHAGNAKFLQQTFHIRIAGSQGDMDKFTNGKTDLSKSKDVSIWGNRLRPYSDLSYPAFTPDVIVGKTNVDLAQYGVRGQIIPIAGGHTPGDLLVLIDDNLFVGDAFVGTFKAQGGGLVPDGHHVREHFFHENSQLADVNLKTIQKIATDHQVNTLYPTHNGPVSMAELSTYIEEEPLLKSLSQLELNILHERIAGKTTLQQTTLADHFILQTAEGKQYTKKQWLANGLMPSNKTIESLAAEDFRIVFSNEHTAVMTHIETIQLKDQVSKQVFVSNTYSKSKDSWKLAYQQLINL